ncbi:MAG TPA: long-chain fatty acid--CoA ligase [Candidatus Cybelea sp.]|jgi:long-chain acyl-CoA synthetase
MQSELPPKQTLPSLIRESLAEPRDEVLVERVEGHWTPASSAQLLQRVVDLACAIRDAGLAAGDRVSLVSHNCVDWIVCDFAALFAGCVVVPIYPTQALDHTAYIIEHSGARLIFVDGAQTLARLRELGAPLPRVVVFDSRGEDGLAAFEARGAEVRAAHPELPATYEAALHPDDLAVLIYTSGTTGAPKGVMLSHDNLAFDARVSLECGFDGMEAGRDVISVLPYSHIYEHTLIYIYLLAKVRYFICHDPGELLADLKDVRPSEMTSVPRIFDRVLAGVKGQALAAGGLRARLVPWALEAGRAYMTAKVLGNGPSGRQSLTFALAKRLVLGKIPPALGLDRVEFLCSGSAPLHSDTAMTFLAMGIPIMQGYGLTETSPIVSVSRLSANEYGAVGRPITGVEVEIAGDGEVLVRGRNVMHGYYHNEEATVAALENGWLHTGDIGERNAAGFLRITDRKGEIFKTDTGKWIAPARIEANIKRSIYVAQALVVGRGRPFPIALICPNWTFLRLAIPQIPAGTEPEGMAARDDVCVFLTREVHTQTAALAGYEQVRKIVIVPHEFSVERGELSPSMKIKRRMVEQHYAAEIERAYEGATAVHAPA